MRIGRRHPAALAILALAVAAIAIAVVGACRPRDRDAAGTTRRDAQLHRLTVHDERSGGQDAGTVAYWGTLDLGAPRGEEASTATRAILVIHGDERNADEYVDYVSEAAGAEGSDAIIIAPRFAMAADRPQRADLRWSDEGWKSGDRGAADAEDAPGVSSFAVADQMIEAILRAAPAVTDVVIAGHSAGGQFAQRYAAGAHLPPGPRYRFVVANPSSYLYLDDRRPSSGSFRTPSSSARRSCEGFDDYKYGPERLNAYMADVGASTLRDQYGRRDVTLLLGAQDRERSGNLDRSCAADLQGDDRLERGMLFYQYVAAQYPPTGRHQLEVVPGIGHDGRAIFNAAAGRAALFRGPGGDR